MKLLADVRNKKNLLIKINKNETSSISVSMESSMKKCDLGKNFYFSQFKKKAKNR